MTKPELKVYAIDGIVPVVDPTAYVHPSAILIGDVIIGPDCYVGPCASLRGDFGRLILERGANEEGTCVMHGFPRTGTVVGGETQERIAKLEAEVADLRATVEKLCAELGMSQPGQDK